MKANEQEGERDRRKVHLPHWKSAETSSKIKHHWGKYTTILNYNRELDRHYLPLYCNIIFDYNSIFLFKWICSRFPIGHLNLNARAKEMGIAACKASTSKRRKRRGNNHTNES